VWIGEITYGKAQTVSARTRDELDKIEAADELELASPRSDAALQEPVTIWVVRHGDDLYVRSMKGRKGWRGVSVCVNRPVPCRSLRHS
jgi:hypothetical protein